MVLIDRDILQEFTNYFELVCQPNFVDADLGFSEEVEKPSSDCSALSNTESMFVEPMRLNATLIRFIWSTLLAATWRQYRIILHAGVATRSRRCLRFRVV